MLKLTTYKHEASGGLSATAELLVLNVDMALCVVRTIKFCSVVFGVTLRLLVINTSSSSPRR